MNQVQTTHKLKLALMAFFVLLSVGLTYVLYKSDKESLDVSAANYITQDACDRTCVNTAFPIGNIDSRDLIAKTKEYGVNWVVLIVSDENEVAKVNEYCNRGFNIIIRPCINALDPSCGVWGTETKNNVRIIDYARALNGISCDVYASGPNEPTIETNKGEFAKDDIEMGQKLASQMATFVNNLDHEKVHVLTPMFAAHYSNDTSWRSINVANSMKSSMGSAWSGIYGLAINTYDVETNSPYGQEGQPKGNDIIPTFSNDLFGSGARLPIFVTETGPMDNNYDRFVKQYDLMLEDLEDYGVEASCVFNGFSYNEDPAFGYSKLVANDRLGDLIDKTAGTECKSGQLASDTGGTGYEGGGSESVCDLLGIDFGIPGFNSLGYLDDPSAEKYFKYRLGVTSTVACPNTNPAVEMDAIDQLMQRTGSQRHIIRLGWGTKDCSFQADQASAMINGLAAAAGDKLGESIFIMPVNEPRQELHVIQTGVSATEFTGTSEDFKDRDENDAGIHDGLWMAKVVNQLTIKDKKYIVFPAFNFHRQDNAGYVATFIQNYNDNSEGTKFDVVYSFGVSVMYEGGSMVTMVSNYMGLLAQYSPPADMKVSVFGANQINSEATIEGYGNDLLATLESLGDMADGAYIFAPWGWDQGATVTNAPIPEAVWDYIFADCGGINYLDSLYSCQLNPVDKYPPLVSCEAEGDDRVFAGVKLSQNGSTGNFEAYPIITHQITEFGLLNWMGNSNIFYDSNDSIPFGTNENPYMPPCGKDKDIITEFEQMDLTQVFSGTVRMNFDNGDYYDYKMPNLGNALACMIYWALDYSLGGEALTLSELEPRFKSGESDYTDMSRRFSSNTLEQMAKKEGEVLGTPRDPNEYDGDEVKCGGLVNRLDETDRLEGPEVIIFDEPQTILREDYAKEAAGTQGLVDDSKGIPYMRIDGRTTDASTQTTDLEILGAGAALAQLYKEETKSNSWKQLKVIHRDQSGVRLSVQKKLYDGLEAHTKGINYKTQLDTAGECTIEALDPDVDLPVAPSGGGGKSGGEVEFIVPWVGQMGAMYKRMSKIFTDNQLDLLEQGEYLKEKDEEISELKDLAAFATISSDKVYEQTYIYLSNPGNLYKCSELDELATKIETVKGFKSQTQKEQLLEFVKNTDCLGSKEESDPLNQWLCENDLLEYEYCIYECIPFSDTTDEDIDDTDAPIVDLLPGSLMWPTTTHYVSQGYGNQETGFHPGIDVGTPVGSDIGAVASGQVRYTRSNITENNATKEYWAKVNPGTAPYWASYGNVVVIDHGEFVTIYAHLQANSITVSPGQTIEKGQRIAFSGNTGYSTGPHLHFEIRKDTAACLLGYTNPGCSFDPLKYLADSYVPKDVDGSRTQPDTGIAEEDIECYTSDGRPGYFFDTTPSEDTDWDFKYDNDLTDGPLADEVRNLCPVNMPSIPESQMINMLNVLGGINDRANGKTDIERRANTRAEMVHRIYEESKNTKAATYPELLVAIWLAENGFNPKIEGDYAGSFSDVFGCGVFCTGLRPGDRGMADFEQELLCVTGRLSDLGGKSSCGGVNYSFNPNQPGSYLETYGPIDAGNPYFADEVMMVLTSLAMIDYGGNPESVRTVDSECNLFVNNVVEDLPWAVGLMESSFGVNW